MCTQLEIRRATKWFGVQTLIFRFNLQYFRPLISHLCHTTHSRCAICYEIVQYRVLGKQLLSGPEKLLENTFVSSQQCDPWCYYSPAIACIYLFFHPSICLPVSVSVWHIHCVVLKFLVTLCDSVHICY